MHCQSRVWKKKKPQPKKRGFIRRRGGGDAEKKEFIRMNYPYPYELSVSVCPTDPADVVHRRARDLLVRDVGTQVDI